MLLMLRKRNLVRCQLWHEVHLLLIVTLHWRHLIIPLDLRMRWRLLLKKHSSSHSLVLNLLLLLHHLLVCLHVHYVSCRHRHLLRISWKTIPLRRLSTAWMTCVHTKLIWWITIPWMLMKCSVIWIDLHTRHPHTLIQVLHHHLLLLLFHCLCLPCLFSFVMDKLLKFFFVHIENLVKLTINKTFKKLIRNCEDRWSYAFQLEFLFFSI